MYDPSPEVMVSTSGHTHQHTCHTHMIVIWDIQSVIFKTSTQNYSWLIRLLTYASVRPSLLLAIYHILLNVYSSPCVLAASQIHHTPPSQLFYS